jgi:elongation factor Ts
MACKKALEEAKGDIATAILILRQQGVKVAEEKSKRKLNAGIIESYIHSTRQAGALVEARSETDFVANNESFHSFVHDIAMHITASDPENIENLLKQPYIKNTDISVEDYIKETIQKFGENIEITRFIRYSV